ncbi:enoyl-CoA hydratase/isomerase family protein [Chloroflexota bacterium]
MAVDYKKEGKIAIFTINRPEAMNALNGAVHRELTEAMLDFRDDPEQWVAIITGAGEKAFSAGADIKEFVTGRAVERYERVAPDQIWKPFIAAINGLALGGGLELALRCDIRITAEHATFGQPEVVIGRMPGGGGTQRLPRFIPRGMAAELLLTGQRISAQEAYRMGIVNKVVPPDQLMPTAMQLAETMCKLGPLGVGGAKEAMVRGYNMTLDEGLQLERDLASRVGKSEDAIEGAKAFAQKRPPAYKGK